MRVSVCSSVRANACAAACAYVLVYLRELDLGVRGELDLGVRGGAGPQCAWGDT